VHLRFFVVIALFNPKCAAFATAGVENEDFGAHLGGGGSYGLRVVSDS